MKIAAWILLTFSMACFAQPPAFDAASVRLSNPQPSAGRRFQISPDTITLCKLSLRDCIQTAWQMPSFQVIGPDWMSDVRLDIVAKAAAPGDEKQLYMMLRKLLADRMGVKAHVERKEVPVYTLTIGKNGPKFSESMTEGPFAMTSDAQGPLMQRISMTEFVRALGNGALDRPVIDSTGLKGRYDIHMHVTPYMPAASDASVPAMERTAIMFSALQDELGLKIEVGKAAMDVLVIEHAERTPTEN